MQIFANYGAMHPVVPLTVKAVSRGVIRVEDPDGTTSTVKVCEVRHKRPDSGSPIGLYWNERDAY